MTAQAVVRPAFRVLLAVASVLVGKEARADWPSSATVNLPVCTASGNQQLPATVTDGAGGAIIAWTDFRSGATPDIYALRVLASGAPDPAWPANGRAICTSVGTQSTVRAVSGGQGDAIIIWQDQRSGSSIDLYAAHVLSDGTIDSAWPLNGAPICTAPGNQQLPAAISDGLGGVLVSWRDFRSDTTSDVYAQHLLATGVADPAWPLGGRSLCGVAGNQTSVAMVTDEAGGAIVCWQDFRAGAVGDIYAQRVNATGTVDPNWPADGRQVCGAAGDQANPVIIRDGAGGAFVAWQDLRSGVDSDIYAAHIMSSGTLDTLWPADGATVCAAIGGQQFPKGTLDGGGGFLLGWADSRVGITPDLYIQHVTSTGSLAAGWPADGIAFCAAPGAQQNLSLSPDGFGGALAVWDDARAGAFDVYAHHVLGSGSVDPAWPADGRALTTATGSQSAPSQVADGSGGVIAAWMDGRPGSTSDIYAQRVQASGSLGGVVVDVPSSVSQRERRVRVSPNPARPGEVAVEFTSAWTVSKGRVEVFDINGRRVMCEQLRQVSLGLNAIKWRTPSSVSTGVYMVKISLAAEEFTCRLAIIR